MHDALFDLYTMDIYIFQADIVPNRSMSSSTSLRTVDKSIIIVFTSDISLLMIQIIRLVVLFSNEKDNNNQENIFVRLKYAYIDMSMNSTPLLKCERGLATNDAYQSVGSSRSGLF